jgi:hypothetical protein
MKYILIVLMSLLLVGTTCAFKDGNYEISDVVPFVRGELAILIPDVSVGVRFADEELNISILMTSRTNMAYSEEELAEAGRKAVAGVVAEMSSININKSTVHVDRAGV